MTDPLSHTRAKQAIDLTASKTPKTAGPVGNKPGRERSSRLTLSLNASEATDRPNREHDVDEPQDPLAMTDLLSHTRAK